MNNNWCADPWGVLSRIYALPIYTAQHAMLCVIQSWPKTCHSYPNCALLSLLSLPRPATGHPADCRRSTPSPRRNGGHQGPGYRGPPGSGPGRGDGRDGYQQQGGSAGWGQRDQRDDRPPPRGRSPPPRRGHSPPGRGRSPSPRGQQQGHQGMPRPRKRSRSRTPPARGRVIGTVMPSAPGARGAWGDCSVFFLLGGDGSCRLRFPFRRMRCASRPCSPF